jgi:putative FmdB family regulatory protein
METRPAYEGYPEDMIYEFECECGNKFEKLLPVYRRDEGDCPKCGKRAKRLFSMGTHYVWVGPPEWADAWKQGKRF